MPEDTTTEQPDRRAILEASLEQAESTGEQESQEIGQPQEEPAGYEAETSFEDKEAQDQEAQREYARDERGKFSPKDEKSPVKAQNKQKIVENGEKQGVQAGPKGPQPPTREWSAEKAPQAWKPEAREYWKDLPEPVRREVVRHAQVANDAISQNVEARRFSEAVQKTIAPYEHFIKAEGSNPVQAIDHLMATAARLRTGTGPELAQMISGMIQQYGVGRFGQGFIESLDQALVGQVPRQDPREAAIRQQIEQEIAPVRQFMTQYQQQQQQQEYQLQNMAQGEIQQFFQQNEFAGDVREDMADLIEMAQKRGRDLSLQEAYDMACRANPSIAKVFENRSRAQAAQGLSQTSTRAKQAAVSVGGAPSMGGGADSATDLRSAIELAIEKSSR